MIWMRRIFALLVATAVTLLFASLAHSLFVQAELAALGVALPGGTRLRGAVADVTGLAPALGSVIALSLAIAFLIAGWLLRRLPGLASLAYPLAGWAAIALALWGMQLVFGFSALAGARTSAGFLAMSLSGLIGGLVFGYLMRSKTSRR
jgi:hypothetical protein